MFIVGIPLTQQPPGQGETFVVFHAGLGGLGFPFWVSCSVPLFDWLSAARLVSYFWEPNPPKPG